MSIDERIVRAVSPIVPEIYPDSYEGSALTYCTYNYAELGRSFAADSPGRIAYLCQLHLLLQSGAPCAELKFKLCRAISKAGFTYPDIQNASSSRQQHYVFEFEVEGSVYYGDL